MAPRYAKVARFTQLNIPVDSERHDVGLVLLASRSDRAWSVRIANLDDDQRDQSVGTGTESDANRLFERTRLEMICRGAQILVPARDVTDRLRRALPGLASAAKQDLWLSPDFDALVRRTEPAATLAQRINAPGTIVEERYDGALAMLVGAANQRPRLLTSRLMHRRTAAEEHQLAKLRATRAPVDFAMVVRLGGELHITDLLHYDSWDLTAAFRSLRIDLLRQLVTEMVGEHTDKLTRWRLPTPLAEVDPTALSTLSVYLDNDPLQTRELVAA